MNDLRLLQARELVQFALLHDLLGDPVTIEQDDRTRVVVHAQLARDTDQRRNPDASCNQRNAFPVRPLRVRLPCAPSR